MFYNFFIHVELLVIGARLLGIWMIQIIRGAVSHSLVSTGFLSYIFTSKKLFFFARDLQIVSWIKKSYVISYNEHLFFNKT